MSEQDKMNAEKETEKAKETEQNSEETQAENQSESQEATETPAEEKKEPTVEEKLAETEKELADYKDSYLRKCADFDNYRKRIIKEKQDAIDYANTNLLSDLLSFLDNLDRALEASSAAKENDSAKSIVEGVSMIQKQLISMLESKYNLVSFGEKGEPFDPEQHEAIASNPAPVAEPVLAEVYLKGYKLKERIIRHAKVMVSMPDGSTDGNSENKEN